MAFNFMAALGGFGRQVSANIESAKEFQREKDFKLELLAEEEATKMRLANAASRRATRQKDAENLAFLKSMGFSDAKASWIMKGGTAAINQYVDWGGKALARGIDPNTLMDSKQFGDDANDPRNEAALATFSGADRPSTIGLSTSVLSEVLADKPKEPDIYNSLAEGHASTFSKLQNEKNKKKPNQDLIKTLEADLAEWKTKIQEDIEMRRTPKDTTETSYFNDDSRARIEQDALKNSYNEQNIQADVEGRITEKIEGRKGQSIIARMNAADSIISQANVAEGVTDFRLQKRGTEILEKAERSLTTYGQGIALSGGGQDEATKKRGYLKNTENNADGSIKPISINRAIENSRAGAYKVGDVVVVAKKENGVIVQKVLVYTDRKSLEDEGVEINGTIYYNMFHDAGNYSYQAN